MTQKDFYEFKSKAKKMYKDIGAVPCPAFNGELVHFNQAGFQHLIRKGHKKREQSEQIKRLALIPDAITILNAVNNFSRYRTSKIGNSTAHFWMVESIIREKPIRVIVRKLSEGPLHFFSVFEKN